MEGQQITIFYNDSADSVSKLIGTLIEQTPHAITIRTPNKKLVTIPLGKVVRIEEDEN
jgi:hypothetical protein